MSESEPRCSRISRISVRKRGSTNRSGMQPVRPWSGQNIRRDLVAAAGSIEERPMVPRPAADFHHPIDHLQQVVFLQDSFRNSRQVDCGRLSDCRFRISDFPGTLLCEKSAFRNLKSALVRPVFCCGRRPLCTLCIFLYKQHNRPVWQARCSGRQRVDELC